MLTNTLENILSHASILPLMFISRDAYAKIKTWTAPVVDLLPKAIIFSSLTLHFIAEKMIMIPHKIIIIYVE